MLAHSASAGADTATAAPGKVALEEVFVFAEKRAASVSDTPVSVTAIDGKTLDNALSFDFTDLSGLTAGVFSSGGNIRADIKIRGVGTEALTTAISAVSVYVDGALQPFPGTAFTSMFDVDQVEILRGPQSTLHGSAAPAGTVNISHRKPSLGAAEVSLRLAAGTHDTRNLQLAAGTPLGEGTAVRVAGLLDRRDPLRIENTTTGQHSGGDSRGLRASLLHQPSADIRLNYSASWINQRDDAPRLATSAGEDPFKRQSTENLDSRYQQEIVSHVLDLQWHFENTSLTSITTYQDGSMPTREDLDGTALLDEQQSGRIDIETWTQEVRLANDQANLWHYIAGVYYSNAQGLTRLQRRLGEDNERVAGLPGIAAILADSTTESEQDQFAVFLHNRFDLPHDLSLTAGIRYNDLGFAQGSNVDISFATNNSLLPQGSIELIPKSQDSYEAFTGGLKLGYDYRDNIMIYASLDRGFRPGGINFNAPPSAAAFEEETSHSLELGLKGEFYGGALRLLVAVFQQDYEDYQAGLSEVTIDDPLLGTTRVANLVDNAGEAEVQGLEIEMTTVVPPWFLHTAISYNDTAFTDYPAAPCTRNGQAAVCDLTGEAINALPRWTAHLTTEYVHRLQAAELYARLISNYQGGRNADSGNDLDGFARFDAYLGLRAPGGRWDAGLWVKNLLDKDAVLAQQSLSREPNVLSQLTTPRHMGISLLYNY